MSSETSSASASSTLDLAQGVTGGHEKQKTRALSVGTPVIACDIPVFREVTQERAILRHPLDGPGWRDAILDLSDLQHPAAIEARRRIDGFVAPTWPGYFERVSAFLAGL